MENHCFRNFAQDTGPRVQCTELQAMSVLTGLCDQETLHCLCHEGREARTRPPRGSNAPYVKVKEQLHAIARTPAGGHLSRHSPRECTCPGRRGSFRARHACGSLSSMGIIVESKQAVAEILQTPWEWRRGEGRSREQSQCAGQPVKPGGSHS